jgi:hypothetical protein
MSIEIALCTSFFPFGLFLKRNSSISRQYRPDPGEYHIWGRAGARGLAEFDKRRPASGRLIFGRHGFSGC